LGETNAPQSSQQASCNSLSRTHQQSNQNQKQTQNKTNKPKAAAAAVADSPAETRAGPSLLAAPAPSTYAIIEVGGSQMFVEPGKWYTVNRLAAEPGAKIKFGRVLALKKDGGKLSVGAPYVEGAAVEAEVLEELRGPKVLVYKMKPKKHYRRTNGHRQDLSKFMVTKVE
jgi:large subunit ribosomal protein L21